MDLLFYNLKPTPLKYSANTPSSYLSLSHHEFFFTVSFSSTKTYYKISHHKKVPPWSHISLPISLIWFSLSNPGLLHCRHTFYHLRKSWWIPPCHKTQLMSPSVLHHHSAWLGTVLAQLITFPPLLLKASGTFLFLLTLLHHWPVSLLCWFPLFKPVFESWTAQGPSPHTSFLHLHSSHRWSHPILWLYIPSTH